MSDRRPWISRIPRLRRLFIVTNPPFQRFLDAHREDVWRFLVAAVGRDAADDCFQETFLAAMRAYPKTRIENPRAWVLTIAHRKALDHHRARARRAVPGRARSRTSRRRPTPSRVDDGVWERVARPAAQAARRAAAALRGRPRRTARSRRRSGASEEAARRSAHEGLKRLREELAA